MEARGMREKIKVAAKKQELNSTFTSTASDGCTTLYTKQEKFVRIEVDALGTQCSGSFATNTRDCHRCPSDGQRLCHTNGFHQTFHLPSHEHRLGVPCLSSPLLTMFGGRKGNHTHQQTIVHYNRNEGAASKNQSSINTGHQSSDCCIALVMRPRTRLPFPIMVNASSLTLIPVLPGCDERVRQGAIRLSTHAPLALTMVGTLQNHVYRIFSDRFERRMYGKENSVHNSRCRTLGNFANTMEA